MQTLKIEVSEHINVFDVFLTTKKYITKTIHLFVESFVNLFTSNAYVDWQAIPVRGPDVSRKSNRTLSYASLA